MKNLAIATLALLMLAGCSQKNVYLTIHNEGDGTIDIGDITSDLLKGDDTLTNDPLVKPVIDIPLVK